VPKDLGETARLLGTAARAGNLDAEVEYAIALFNGTGIAKDEAGAVGWFRRAAHQGSPIAQNRLARILAAGRGAPADPVEATKWHLIAKAAGESDPWLDSFVGNLKPAEREAGEKAAKPWLASLPPRT
jgi:TPR repeat protein